MGGNDEYPWDDFDSSAYTEKNYLSLRPDDAQILAAVAEHFGSADPVPGRGVDVGSGANLYPALALLPFCADIDLWEFSAKNVDWLHGQLPAYSPTWDAFWQLLIRYPAYKVIDDPRAELAKRARVLRRSIFDLPAGHWDIGTMFFVAESLTGDRAEFEKATLSFVRALRPAAPFAAAFMEHSEGYWVGDQFFPAVSVGVADIEGCLAEVTGDLRVQRFDSTGLRAGYKGMILATGRTSVG